MPTHIFLFQHATNAQYICKSIAHNDIAASFLKPFTLAEFKPGSSYSEAVAMVTAPLRQGLTNYLIFFLWLYVSLIPIEMPMLFPVLGIASLQFGCNCRILSTFG
jgi:hypothetical protein